MVTGCLGDLSSSYSNLQSLKKSNHFGNTSKNGLEKENKNESDNENEIKSVMNAGNSRSFINENKFSISDVKNKISIGKIKTGTFSNLNTNSNENINISAEQIPNSNINITPAFSSSFSSSLSVTSSDTYPPADSHFSNNITAVIFDCFLLLETNPIAEMKCKYMWARTLPSFISSLYIVYFLTSTYSKILFFSNLTHMYA